MSSDDNDREDSGAPDGSIARGSTPSAPNTPACRTSAVRAPSITASSIAARTKEFREATWRTALARALAGDTAHARTAILVAAMSGTLSQIKSETLTSRASLLVGATFPEMEYDAKIAAIRALTDAQAVNVLAVIGAAYAKDVANFSHVADLARAFDIDLRDSWQVDQTFLDRYTRDELAFVARDRHRRLNPLALLLRISIMLIASLMPLLARYSLGFDLVAGPDDAVTLTIIPRRAQGATAALEAGEVRPISITASAAEIDAELARGTDGALGQLITARRTLADQIADQRQAAEVAKRAAADAAKARAAAAPPGTKAPAGVAHSLPPTSPPADARADEPASLF